MSGQRAPYFMLQTLFRRNRAWINKIVGSAWYQQIKSPSKVNSIYHVQRDELPKYFYGKYTWGPARCEKHSQIWNGLWMTMIDTSCCINIYSSTATCFPSMPKLWYYERDTPTTKCASRNEYVIRRSLVLQYTGVGFPAEDLRRKDI